MTLNKTNLSKEDTALGCIELDEDIASIIRSQGPITFARYMELALYHPTRGYYMTPKRRLGREGDFYTSSHVHSVFGETLALQVMEMDRLLGGKEFSLIEWGGGMGYLAGDILTFIKSENPSFFERLKYIFIEKSPYLQKSQQEYLQNLGLEEQVGWYQNGRELVLAGLSLTSGCILANELLDAMPVHRVVKSTRGLQEIYVIWEKNNLKELKGDLSPRVEEHLRAYPLSLIKGQEIEVCPSALYWLEESSKLLNKGFIVIFDYGYELNELADPLHSKGTVIGYRDHQTVDKVLDEPGQVDLTAHVNFSTLKQKGLELGLRDLGLLYQSNFLMNGGIMTRLKNLKAAQAMKHLVMPGGMGTTFRVQGFAKGITTTPNGFTNSY